MLTRTRPLLGFLLLQIFCTMVPAQDSLYLNITYPAQDDTFRVDKLRLAGVTHPQADLTINGKSTPVFANGAFATRIGLLPGWNEILFSSRLDTLVRDTLYVYHIPNPGAFTAIPSRIDSAMVQPGNDVWLLPGDKLNVRIKASPGGRAVFSIENGMKNIPMTELPPWQVNGLRGIYHGVVQVDAKNSNKSLSITVEFRGMDGEKHKIQTPGKLFIMTDTFPLVGMTRRKTILWNAGTGGSRIGVVPDSVYLHIIGKIGERNKVQLSQHHFAFINAANVHLLPVGTPLPRTEISTGAIVQDKHWVKLIMNTELAVPFVIQQRYNPSRVQITLYGAHQGYQWITYPNIKTPVKNISWTQKEPDVLQITIEIEQTQLWGYKAEYESGQLILAVRKPPAFLPPPSSPFKEVIFAIDPGHGGEEPGAISSTGIEEKAVNLEMAKALYEKLVGAGATAMLTRRSDSTLSLSRRLDIADSVKAHILISLHNNSIGPSSPPLRVRGTSVYYYTPHSKALAWAIYPHLVDLGLQPFGRVYTSFYLTRPTGMISVLVEGVFMSNPYDEMIMQAENYAENTADAIFVGIRDFLQSIQKQAL